MTSHGPARSPCFGVLLRRLIITLRPASRRPAASATARRPFPPPRPASFCRPHEQGLEASSPRLAFIYIPYIAHSPFWLSDNPPVTLPVRPIYRPPRFTPCSIPVRSCSPARRKSPPSSLTSAGAPLSTAAHDMPLPIPRLPLVQQDPPMLRQAARAGEPVDARSTRCDHPDTDITPTKPSYS
jgi:hypothetical protein